MCVYITYIYIYVHLHLHIYIYTCISICIFICMYMYFYVSICHLTLVLPCRHMCFCSYCAGIVRLQCDKCPVCRQKVQSLLQFQQLPV